MTTETILSEIRKRQTRRELMPCPRCGEETMDRESPFKNALSRAIDLQVCDACGNIEAIEWMNNELKPVSDWCAVRHPKDFVGGGPDV